MNRGLEKASWPGRCQTLPATACLKPPKYFNSVQPSRRVRYHLDCAHTPLSMEASCEWFNTTTSSISIHSNARRILIFNCSHEKDPLSLLRCLFKQCNFECAVFCPPGAGRPSRFLLPSSDDLLRNSGILRSDDSPQPYLVGNELKTDGSASANDLNIPKLLQWQFTLAEVWSALLTSSSSIPTTYPTTVVAPNLTSALHWASTNSCVLEDDVETHIFVVGSVYLVGGALELLS